ncbi:MAG: response regulator [Candidatus Nitrosotenuis sp.]
MKILLVDDNADITTMFSKYFGHNGHECMVANSGQNGLEMILNQDHDVILLDLAMPDFSGFDIVDHLYKNGKLDGRTIVALTASSVSDNDKDNLQKKGVHSVLKKPIDPDDLLAYLAKISK